MEVSCIILAGGRAKRLKKDKAFLILNKRPLIDYSVKIARKFFSDIIIVVKKDRQIKKLKKMYRKIKFVKDDSRIFSPIAGIKEGIKHAKNDYVFVLACDMPFVKEKTIRELLVRTGEGLNCIAYIWALNRYEPLCAIYSKKVFAKADIRKSLHSLINKIRNKAFIPIAMETNEFFNINTKRDLKKARKLLRKKSRYFR